MNPILSIIIIVIFLFFPSTTLAEVKEIISEGTYNMGDGETPGVAESRALLQAKRIALEQAGTYVESWTKVINLQLTEDEIKVLASGIMEVEVIDKKRTIVGDGFHFWVKIKAIVNLDKTEEMAKRVREKSVVEDYKKIQEAYDKSQKDIEELKKQLAQAKGEKEKKQVEAKITDNERLFQANEWYVKGVKYLSDNKYDEAIEAFTSAIALNPNYADAYNTRGVVYSAQKKYDRAITEYEKAIEAYISTITLDPNDAAAYFNRGVAYFNKAVDENIPETKTYDMAIEDFNRAIALIPNYDVAYIIRGQAYYYKGNMGRAISDFQKACDIGNENGCEGLQMALEKR